MPVLPPSLPMLVCSFTVKNRLVAKLVVVVMMIATCLVVNVFQQFPERLIRLLHSHTNGITDRKGGHMHLLELRVVFLEVVQFRNSHVPFYDVAGCLFFESVSWHIYPALFVIATTPAKKGPLDSVVN